MPKYGEMVPVCQENIHHLCICRKIVFELRSLDLEGLVDYTLIKRKSRMPHIQGVTGEAVVNYCEPVTTPKMGYHRLSQRVNKTDIK
jgi:hypothetical protein